MLAPRSVAFFTAFVALIAINLLWARLTGLWERPRIPEASEVMGYYLGVVFAVVFGAVVVGALAFPSAVVADRLFQRKGMSRAAPYALFFGVSVIITATLLVSREGKIHAVDVPAAIVYFASASCIVWKISYESPKQKKA